MLDLLGGVERLGYSTWPPWKTCRVMHDLRNNSVAAPIKGVSSRSRPLFVSTVFARVVIYPADHIQSPFLRVHEAMIDGGYDKRHDTRGPH